MSYSSLCNLKPGTERVQALAFGLCCHSNETRAPILNPPNSAQLEGTPCHSPKLHLGEYSSVGMQQWTDRHTGGHDHYTFCLGYASCKM